MTPSHALPQAKRTHLLRRIRGDPDRGLALGALHHLIGGGITAVSIVACALNSSVSDRPSASVIPPVPNRADARRGQADRGTPAALRASAAATRSDGLRE